MYDLSSFESCINFLKSFLKIDEHRLKEFIVSQDKENDFSYRDLDTFIENFEIELSDCDQDKIIFCGVHITTNKDRCKSIKKIWNFKYTAGPYVGHSVTKVFL